MRVFLSYGHDEHAVLAGRLKADLELRGHEVWFDLDRLKPGADWEAYIDEGLDWVKAGSEAGRVILLMTPHSVRRPEGYCLNEIARAVSAKLMVVPVMVVWSKPPLSICRIQWLDMQDCVPLDERRDRYEAKFPTLLEALEEGKLDMEGAQSRLLSVCQPLPFDADISFHLTRFTGRQWVFDRIDRWLTEEDASRIFWITGSPGIGKTAIASWLCHHRSEVVAFHLCRHGHAQKSDPRRCVLSIAYQLASQLPEYAARLTGLNLEEVVAESGARTLFDSLIVQPLSGGFPAPDRTHVILIDALDEATHGGRNELASFIATEFAKTPSWLRLIITSRPEPEVKHPLQGLDPYVVDADRPENREDIRAFLDRELKPYAGETGIAPHTIETIVEHSGGIFLYVEWLRQELAVGRLSVDRPDEFPQGLGGVYAGFFERQFPNLDFYRREVVPALEVVAACREPVRIDMLSSIFDWDERSRVDFFRALGSLFPVADDRVQPFHRSLADWLTDPDRAGPYFASEERGHQRLSAVGWEEHSRGLESISDYTLAHLPAHLVHAKLWSELERLLTDLGYVEAKCRAGMAFDLVSDYESALKAWPDLELPDIFRSPQVEDLVDGAAAVLEMLLAVSDTERDPGPKEPDKDPEEAIPDRLFGADRTVAATIDEIRRINLSQEEAGAGDGGRSAAAREFANFVSSHSHVLSSSPREALPLARNHASGGEVATCAERMTENLDRAWLARDPRPPPPSLRPACVRTLLGHSGKATSVSLSADASTAVSAGEDGTLRVWDTTSGRCRRVLYENDEPLAAVALSVDGRTALAGGEDRFVRIWDTVSGECLKVLESHRDTISSVAMGSDGRLVVSAAWDNSARIWDPVAGSSLKKLEGHADKVTGIALTPDARLAISSSADSTVRIWDVASGKCLRVLRGHTFWCSCVAVTANGRLAVSAAWDETLCFWDVATGDCLRVLDTPGYWVHGVALTPDGRLMVAACSDRRLRVWDVSSIGGLRALGGHAAEINDVALSRDGRLAVSASDDYSVRVWDVAGGVSDPAPEGHAGVVRGVIFAPDGKTAISAGMDRTIRVWDAASGKCLRKLGDHNKYVFGVAVTADSTTAVSVSRPTPEETRLPAEQRTTLRVWDTASGEVRRPLRGHRSSVEAVAITSDGRTAVSTSWDKTLRVWNIESGQCVRLLQTGSEREGFTGYMRDAHKRSQGFESPSEAVTGVSLTPDGRLAVSETEDKRVYLWDLPSGRCLTSFGGRTGVRRVEKHLINRPGIALTPDGKIAVSLSWDRDLHVWHVEAQRRRWQLEGPTDRVAGVSLSPNGRLALARGYDQKICLWELSSGKRIHAFEGHSDDINDVVFSPDGCVAVSASDDRTVRLWEVDSGACEAIYHASARVLALSTVRPDGRFACASSDGQLHFLSIEGLDHAPPLVTAVRLLRLLPSGEGARRATSGHEPQYAEDDLMPCRHDAQLTTLCPWCGRRFEAKAAVLDALEAIARNAGLSPDRAPCIELPPEAWDDAALESECPECRRVLRFNPYLVDNEAGK
jgi:WD40 repeat protein